MSILDAAVLVGLEGDYGTPATLTRAFEAKADTFNREQSRLESVGFRADMQTLRDDRVVTVNMGAVGSIECDMLNKGMGLLLRGMLGGSAGPTQVGVTDAYLQTFTSNDAGPTESYTVQIIRPKTETGTEPFTYHGGKVISWNLGQSPDGLLTVTFDFDFEDSDHSTAAGTPSYPADSYPFDWSQCTVTLDPDGTPETLDCLDLSFAANLAMKTDRRYLRGSELKKEPIRSGIPEYTGEIAIDFSGTTRYDEWTAGTTVDIEVSWVGAVIGGAESDSFSVRLPAVQWTGGNPEVSLSETPVQTLPFKVHHDGANNAVTVTYQSADTAF